VVVNQPLHKAPGGKDDTWLSWLRELGKTVIPALLTAGGLLGFVAFAGSVIVWTRFSAAQVPPDQVVAAYPRGELVAIASALLLLFGFVGLLAVVAFFLINPQSGSGNGYMRGLLVLLGVEGMVAIFLCEASSPMDRVLACELFLLPAIIAFWTTFVFERPWVSGEKDKEDQEQEQEGRGGDREDDFTLADLGDTLERYLLKMRFVSLALAFGIAVSLLALMLIFVPRVFGGAGLPGREVAIVSLGLVALVPSVYLLYILIKEDTGKKRKFNDGEIPFSPLGQALILILLAVAAIGPSVILRSGWLPFSLATAAALVAGLWRIAVMTRTKFFWYGLAVFISVPLFGTMTGMFRNIADPQVQPMALIRKADGADEAIQGLYVTETDDRIYFATVATEGCTDDLVPNSGRLLWVPKSEVVALSIGPLQSVKNAAKTALEMSYALTPAVETPAGDHVSLTVAEKRQAAGPEAAAASQERRLESVGNAVQPNFGAGLRLIPESASPGDIVTLQMSAPNHSDAVEGFGPRREGRTLRLGGVPVDIVKEEARGPFDVEFAEGENGETLSLVKGVIYTTENGQYVEVDPDADISGEEELFVRVNDPTAAEVNDKGLAKEGYLRLADGSPFPPHLAYSHERPPEVVLEDGTELKLNRLLLQQNWHEDHIRFRVPARGTTGPVTVECRQLAGQPLLRVARPPIARVMVRIEPGSNRVVFDSSRSVDKNGSIVSRQWSVEGVDRGEDPQIVETLPPSTQSYTVRLRVTDREGQTGTAELHLLRLPIRWLAGEGRKPDRADLRRVKAALRHSTTEEPATAIQFELRPGEPARPPTPEETISQARRAQRLLLQPPERKSPNVTANPNGITVRTMAFDASCPAEHSQDGGRLDVLVLGEGVKAVPPAACTVVGQRTTHRLLLPP
jgi:hypothetical protein